MTLNEKLQKIEKIISDNFDTRMEVAVLSYLIEKGTETLKEITEEEILQIKGNAFMTDRFCQALVRTAVIIAKEFTTMDIMEFIRLSANFTPYPKEVILYREDFGSSDWMNLLDVLDIDYYNNQPETIQILTINKENLMKGGE